MNMLVENLRIVSESPLAWSVLAILAVFGIASAWRWSRCPILAGTMVATPEAARAITIEGEDTGPRFFLTMLAGIAVTIAGITLIANGIRPALAFCLLVAGVFVIQTEPARLQLREAERRALAATAEGGAALEDARAQLRTGHIWLFAINLLIVLAVTAGLLAF